jgi:opacity protein-like surface antigen
MKKLVTSGIVLTLFSAIVMAQSLYIRPGIGYGLAIAASSIGENQTRVDIYSNSGTISESSTKGVYASYGAGFDASFALDYEINKNVIIDLNFQFLMGKHYKTGSTYDNTGGSFVENDYNITETHSTGLLINPSVVFSAGFGKAAPYGRIGFITGNPTIKGKNSNYYNGDGISDRQTEWEYTKGFAFGFQSAVGMNWKLTDKIDLFSELNFVGLTYYPGNYTLTASTYDGINNMANYSVSQKEIIYKRKFDPSAVNIDSAKPATELKKSTPFSSISLQAGIRFPLWRKAE